MPLPNELVFHHCDVGGRSAEYCRAELQEDEREFSQRRLLIRRGGLAGARGDHRKTGYRNQRLGEALHTQRSSRAAERVLRHRNSTYAKDEGLRGYGDTNEAL